MLHKKVFNTSGCSLVKMFLSSRQADYSNRQQRPKLPEYKSDKCEVSGRYFVVGGGSYSMAELILV